ncbi:phosphatase PAP2 family protein, partial [Saccharopolyspora sp. NPDC002686]
MAELTTATNPEGDVAASADEAPATVTPETVALRKVQGALAKPAVVKTARAMSLFGEHAGGWLAIGAIGALVDR